jgi:putative peptide modification system cyclase
MNALAQPAAPIAQSVAIPLLRTLVLCDLVDSTALTERLGDQRAADLFRKHDRLARALLPIHGGREIDKTDGFLLMFERPLQAVAFALDYQRALRELNAAEGSTLAARVGIHVGDVVAWENSPEDIARGAKPFEIEGLVKPITSRLMQHALPRQILLSGVAHALAHRAQGELGERLGTVRWRTHGRYRFKGIPDPIPVFEVGDEGFAPLKAPPWSGKAHREVPFWRRPATLGIELAGVLALLAVPAWYLLKPAPAIAFAQRDWVVVGDLRNLTGDTSFDASIQTAFRIGLEQSRYVNVLSTLKARETVQLMQRDPEKTPVDRAVGAEIAIRDGARAVILPTIAEIGGRVRVTAEVVDPQTQTTVYSESADGVGAESVLPSLDVVNQKLRVRLGEALATVSKESRPLEKVATANLEALRAYSLAVNAYANGETKNSIELLRHAIELDPDFALAHVLLGNVLNDTGGGESADAIIEVRKALAIGDRLSSRDELFAKAWLANFEEPRDALDKWRMLSRLYPDFSPASGALSYFEYYLANDFTAASEALNRNAVSTNPKRANGDYLHGVLLVGMEDFANAEKRFDRAFANGFRSQQYYRAYAYAAQRDFRRADEILSSGSVSAIRSEEAEKWTAAIMLAIDQGHWHDALERVGQARSDVSSLNDSLRRHYARIDLALQSQVRDMPLVESRLADLATLHASPKNPDHEFDRLLSAYVAARVGRVDLANAAWAEPRPFAKSGDYPYLTSFQAVVAGEIRRANGHANEAVAALRTLMDGREYYLAHDALLRASIDAGEYAPAYEQALWLASHRGRAYVEQFGQASLQPLNVALSDIALLHQAELALKLGKADASRKALARFKQAWPSTEKLPAVTKRVGELEQALAAFDQERPT